VTVPAANPFLDSALARDRLYATADRLSARTSALLTARTTGTPVTEVLIHLAQTVLGTATEQARVLDIGCGRGSTSLALTTGLRPATLIALDAAPAMLTATRQRLAAGSCPPTAQVVAGDFHRLPIDDRSIDLAVAAFCLYHSTRPSRALAEIARCLRPGAAVIVATKSRDSYAELDQLVATAGLDPLATERPSLYQTLHSDNLADLTATAFTVEHVQHDQHLFRFTDLGHAATYLATSPKYQFPHGLAGDPAPLAAELRRRLPDRPVETLSTVSYAIGRRRAP
jgi:ubiquinone/menaquinone biosynthesis C-methylase UbiE